MNEPKMITIPEGEYTLGVPTITSGLRHIWEGPRAVASKAFLMAETAVTVKEFAEYLLDTKGTIDGDFADLNNWDGELPEGGPSWDDAFEYAEWLKGKTGKPYRLPTGDEWEIAARGGLVGKRFPWGDETVIGRCNSSVSRTEPWAIPEPVKSYEPNGYGLYGMVGGIWCWCADLWVDYVKNDPPENTPTGRPAEINRVLRGGSFLTSDELFLMCACIHEDPPELRHKCLGMRLACDV